MTKQELHPKNPDNKYLRAYSDAVKRGRKIQHVVPRENGWAVKKTSSEKASGIFADKNHAISRACEIAKNQRSEVLVHNRDGKISRRVSCTTK